MNHDMIVCTDSELVVLVPISDLLPHSRAVISAWLLEHDVDPHRLAVGYPVERDPYASSLRWRINGERGREVVTIYSPKPRGSWPAPFPDDLLTADLAA